MQQISPPSSSRLRPQSYRRQGARPYEVSCPAPRALWLELYSRDPEALPSQAPAWLDCLCSFGGYKDASRLYTFSDGQQLLMPMVRRKGLPSPVAVQASFPYAWSVGGVLARRSLQVEDLQAVFDDLAATPFLITRIFPNPRQGELWRAAQPSRVTVIPRRAHVLDLEGGFGKVWGERFASNTRNKVRKAEKLGVEVECDTSGRAIPIFYELYRRSIDRWAEQQHEPRWLAHQRAEQRDPRRKLEHISRSLGETCQVWVARHAGQPVAAILVFSGVNADYAMGAMDKALAAPVYASNLIQKLAIEKACETGCRLYHMGESGTSEGIARFKESLGAQSYPYSEYRLERLPLTRIDRNLRGAVKRLIGFQDA